MVSKQQNTLHYTPLILLTILILVSSNPNTVTNYTDFIYKKCQNQTHLPHNLVSSLIQELVQKSTKTKFYQTTTGDDTFAVSGVFQCRHDLTYNTCHNCIMTTLHARFSCTSGLLLTRIQLKGCYMSLEPEPDPKYPDIDNRVLIGVQEDYVQHKKCGERRSVGFEGLQEVKNAAFEAIVMCIMRSEVGHCGLSHEGVYGVAQCEGGLEECECGKCVANAFQVAQDECWGSVSGEVYLANCFVSFSDDHRKEGGGHSSQGVGGAPTTKAVAMVLGIGVALALLSALCYCIRSSRRKRDDW